VFITQMQCVEYVYTVPFNLCSLVWAAAIGSYFPMY